MTPINISRNAPLCAFFIAILACVVIGVSLFAQVAQADTIDDPAFPFYLTKKFSGEYPAGYTAAQFTFDITGVSLKGTPVSMKGISLTRYTDDTANTTVELPPGTYSITEHGPTGFIPSQWTVQWSGYGCDNANGPSLSTSMTARPNDPTANVCTADNQWRPGKLVVEKRLDPGSTASPKDFSFKVVQGKEVRYEGPFNEIGVVTVLLGAGAYEVTETVTGSYTPSYSSGCSGTIAQNGGASCIITNHSEPVPPTTGTIIIEKQTVPDGNPTSFTFDPSWTGTDVSLRDGETFTSTSMNAGTYSIVETLPTGWTQTGVSCSDGSTLDALVLGGGETLRCVVTNTYKDTEDTFTISGYKWEDVNGDGERSTDEPLLPNWTIQAVLEGTSTHTTKTVTTGNDGMYSMTVGAGTWVLTEGAQSGWKQTFPRTDRGACTVTFPGVPSVTSATCNFGNQKTGGGEDTRYLVYGYVWHDANKNDVWEKSQPDPGNDEHDLDGWTVQISRGGETYATTTDSAGYYFFHVSAGDWTVREILETGWSQTYPNDAGTHLVSVSSAQSSYGPYNFGNAQSDGGGGGGGGGGDDDDDDDGGGGSGSGGGGGSSSSGSGSKKSSGQNGSTGPVPQVLGTNETFPVGAPNTGGGGTAPIHLPVSTAMCAILPSRSSRP